MTIACYTSHVTCHISHFWPLLPLSLRDILGAVCFPIFFRVIPSDGVYYGYLVTSPGISPGHNSSTLDTQSPPSCTPLLFHFYCLFMLFGTGLLARTFPGERRKWNEYDILYKNNGPGVFLFGLWESRLPTNGILSLHYFIMILQKKRRQYKAFGPSD